MHKTKTAVDTIVLTALACKEERAIEACRKLQNIGHSLLVTSTVMQECELMCRSSKPFFRQTGETIVANLVDRWGIWPAPAESSVNHGIALQLTRAIEQQFTLPEGFEDNHGLVISEAGLVGCSRLLTWNQILLSLPRANLSLFLESRDLRGVQILTPDEALSALCPDD